MLYNKISFLFLSPPVADQLISKAVTNDEILLEKLSKKLDRESRHIRCWKHLACVLDVPVGERRKFARYTEHSPTEDMFNYLADVWKPDLKVKDLKRELKDIYRNDVIQSLNEGMQTSAVLFLLPVVCYLSGSLCYRSFTVLTDRGHPCLWNFPVALRNKLIFPRQTTNKTYGTQTIATNLIINKETEIRQNYQ